MAAPDHLIASLYDQELNLSLQRDIHQNDREELLGSYLYSPVHLPIAALLPELFSSLTVFGIFTVSISVACKVKSLGVF